MQFLIENVDEFDFDNSEHAEALYQWAKAAEKQIARLEAIIAYIDKLIPPADFTCEEPGIAFSKAVERQLIENGILSKSNQ